MSIHVISSSVYGACMSHQAMGDVLLNLHSTLIEHVSQKPGPPKTPGILVLAPDEVFSRIYITVKAGSR